MSNTVSLSFFRFNGLARFWALTMMGVTPFRLRRVPGLGFNKLCGSGRGEGFTPTLLPKVFAILGTWDDEDAARTQIVNAPVFQRYSNRASEAWHVFLQPTSARGEWSGVSPFTTSPEPAGQPLAALTRATIKLNTLRRFWGKVPNISAAIGADPNVVFKIGIGEVPLLHQATFSIWPDSDAMAAFARRGHHQDAITSVRTHGWFKEELYARFAVTGDLGTWNGTSPLDQLEQS